MTSATTAARAMTSHEWALLLALSLLWGASFLLIAIAVRELPPFTLVLARVALAALALWLAARLAGRLLPLSPSLWLAFAVMGVLNNLIPFSLIVWAQTRIPGGLASILNATMPLWTVLLAHFLTRDERLTVSRLLGVLLGFAGVAVMLGPAVLAGLGQEDLPAQLAVLLASLSYALSSIWGRRFRSLPPMVIAACQLTATTAMMLPIVLVIDRPWTLPLPGPGTLAAVAALALLSTALAYILFFRVLATAGAGNVGLVTLLIPVSAILLGTLLLDERLDPRHLAGMALIGLGLAAIDGRLLARLLRRRPVR